MFYAIDGFNVAVSCDRRKLNRFVRNRGWSKAMRGHVNRQTFLTPRNFQEAFGPCVVHDVDQKLRFRPDFSLCPMYGGF